ncbi:L,D-transpeptidase [Nocardioides sp. GY 10113]|uniref:L,D-transpeptidase n=1 Tax=Nocardioides sp. GY 10113 TaxID=2569761 RepID=UPI001F0F2A08|nr:L,D-transpeptidase [Nocardioides sp. GY 10113]
MSEPERGHRATSLVVAILACAALVVTLRACGDDDPTPTSSGGAVAVDLHRLRASTTDTAFKAAPLDPHPDRPTSGLVVHPRRMTAVHDAPAGTPFAKVGPRQFGDTWLPVIAERRGWVRVLLPSRPNGSTGWLARAGLQRAHSRFQISVHLGSRTLTLSEDGVATQTWSVAVGAGATPTPTGRTFLLGQLVDQQQSFSPLILPLGAHSPTLDTYGGGAGTVAIHGWTDPSVFGRAVSHGCIRVPDDALSALSRVPVGSPVLIDDA